MKHEDAQEGAEKNGDGSGESESDGAPITLYTTTYYIGLEIKPLATTGPHRQLDISSDSVMFKTTCTSWPAFQPGINDLTIAHIRK
ncbi:polynucleotide adenylyltransferase [Ascosphaera acerosa]|nr:polynucleotide adenylyltransferase [Ascosphaera acerosa]